MFYNKRLKRFYHLFLIWFYNYDFYSLDGKHYILKYLLALCCFVILFISIFISSYAIFPCDKWGPCPPAWRVLRLRLEELPAIWRLAVNILNKQSRTEDKEWSSSLGFGRGVNNSS